MAKSATDEFQNPLPQKVLADRVIYLSRNNFGEPSTKGFSGIVQIIDFGYSVLGGDLHYGPIQVEPFRAPEVILDAGWTYSSDIWNLGVMVRISTCTYSKDGDYIANECDSYGTCWRVELYSTQSTPRSTSTMAELILLS